MLKSNKSEGIDMYRENLGSKLKAARNKTGFTQSEVAEMTDIKQSQISKIENGTPRERRIAVMALRCGLAAIAGENITGI